MAITNEEWVKLAYEFENKIVPVVKVSFGSISVRETHSAAKSIRKIIGLPEGTDVPRELKEIIYSFEPRVRPKYSDNPLELFVHIDFALPSLNKEGKYDFHRGASTPVTALAKITHSGLLLISVDSFNEFKRINMTSLLTGKKTNARTKTMTKRPSPTSVVETPVTTPAEVCKTAPVTESVITDNTKKGE